MRAIVLFAIAAVFVCAKDNFVFDYQPNAQLGERIERLEREIAELKSHSLAIQVWQEAFTKKGGDPRIGKLEALTARLNGDLGVLSANVAKLAKNRHAAATKIVQTPETESAERLDKVELEIAALKKLAATAQGTQSAQPQPTDTTRPTDTTAQDGTLKIKIDTIADRLFTLEADLKTAQERLDKSAGFPFDEYLPVTKASVEYFVLGLTIFVLLMLVMLLSASGRASRAENKIEQLVKLYQSSSRKSEERK